MMNRIYCLNPDCLHPNPDNFKYCQKCGSKLALTERYIPRSILGQGGFGRTFLATDQYKPSQPYCVIKQFLPQAQGTDSIEKASQLFAQEAQRLEELGKHPQIPELMAYFIVDGRQYLVQEFVQGNTLQAELDNNGVFGEKQIRELLLEILEILEFVHSKQVIHRDIKPENIIRRSSDNKLFLVDFGAAKVVKPQQRTATGTIIGSAEYCPPEQSMGKPLFISDLYSLGVTCLHLLTGTSPFDLYSPLEGEWVWRDYLNGNVVSDELGKILEKLAHPIAKHRFQSVAEVIHALSPVSPTVPPSSFHGKNVNNQARRINPDDAVAYYNSGNFYYEQKKWELAIADYNRALAINPDNAYAYTGRGNVYYNQKKWELALADYNRALAINPDDAYAYNGRGNVYEKQKKWELALADYNRALAINPDYDFAYNGRGWVYYNQKKWELALADYNRALAINPDNDYAYNNRGIVYYDQKKWELALADYNRALAINPDNNYAYINRGRVYCDQKKWELAIADYNRARAINPNLANTYKDLFIPPLSYPTIQTQSFEFETATITVRNKGLLGIGKTYEINRSRRRAEFFTEDLGNGVLLDMVSIPGGTFLMGSPENEPERHNNESPQHSVTIQPFFIGKFPVTQAQWAVVAGYDKVKMDLNPHPSHFKGDNRPVEMVSWDDAVEFCARLSQRTGKTYRLPSEAEWEYACRAGTTTPFYFGNTITTDLANYDGNYTYGSAPKGEYRKQTTDVGKFPANPFGLFDMFGNTWEWCQDECHSNYNNAPVDGSPWLIDNDNRSRCVRGGCWYNHPRYCRSASRYLFLRAGRVFIGYDIGFRVVCAVGKIVK